MANHSDGKYVPEYSDIVLGSLDGIMSVLSTYPKKIKEIEDGSGIITLDEFRRNVESDNSRGAGIDTDFIPQMYEDYVEDEKEELAEIKNELEIELRECLKLNHFSSSIDTEFGRVDFFMCRRDTEGCRFSIVPHEWICHIRDESGSPTLTIYGSAYSPAFEGSANSRQMFEICDMHTHQELHMYFGYLNLLQRRISQGAEDMDDPNELMDSILFSSPLVFVQYMKRDVSKAGMKGAGILALKHSLSCINNKLESDDLSLVVCPEIYGYFKKGAKSKALAKIKNLFDALLVEDGSVCNRIDYLKFDM